MEEDGSKPSHDAKNISKVKSIFGEIIERSPGLFFSSLGVLIIYAALGLLDEGDLFNFRIFVFVGVLVTFLGFFLSFPDLLGSLSKKYGLYYVETVDHSFKFINRNSLSKLIAGFAFVLWGFAYWPEILDSDKQGAMLSILLSGAFLLVGFGMLLPIMLAWGVVGIFVACLLAFFAFLIWIVFIVGHAVGAIPIAIVIGSLIIAAAIRSKP
jgi:hypothetical protein